MKTINEIAKLYGVHPTQVSQWKKELTDNADSLFEGKRGPKHRSMLRVIRTGFTPRSGN